MTTALHRRFPPELRTASVVPRWSIVWTLTRDSVSNHSYFVAVYSREIAKVIGWKGDLGDLMYLALVHDLDETITGDLVSPIKDEIVDNKRAEAFIAAKMTERLPFVAWDTADLKTRPDYAAMKLIIKVADRLDALIFLIGEARLGNGVIAPHLPRAWQKMKDAWFNLPGENIPRLWNEVMLPAIKEHETNGGFGI